MAHFNASDAYFGTYATFRAPDKRTGAVLAGPDSAVGDIGTVTWQLDENKRQQAWLENPYGAVFGCLDASTSHTLALYRAKGWTIRYVLSFTAYSELPEPGEYWGQAAIIAFAPRYTEQFEIFLHTFAQRMGEGLRPDPALGASTVESIINDPSSWKPTSKVKIPQGNGRCVVLKDHRTLHDKLLDQARSKNPGCYIIGWAFIFALIAGVAWMLHSLGVF